MTVIVAGAELAAEVGDPIGGTPATGQSGIENICGQKDRFINVPDEMDVRLAVGLDGCEKDVPVATPVGDESVDVAMDWSTGRRNAPTCLHASMSSS